MSVTKNNQSHFHFTNYCRCPCFFPDIPHSSIDTYFTKKVSFQAGPSCKVAHRSISRIDMHRKCRSPPIFEISHHHQMCLGQTNLLLIPVQKKWELLISIIIDTHMHQMMVWGGKLKDEKLKGGKKNKVENYPCSFNSWVPCTRAPSGLSNKATSHLKA